MTPPFFACAQSFFTWRQKMRPTTTSRKAPPTTIAIETTGLLEMLPRLSLKEPGTDRKR